MPRFYHVTKKENAMGQQHNPNQNSRDSLHDERMKKAQQGSDQEQKHGMPGTFKNDPDKKGEKSKSPNPGRH
ncbi:MAG TPA: hypothetical protein VID67_13880 [Rhizomicrobium sp.]|jgi:hypothetical protein